jgi:hypothetical protein
MHVWWRMARLDLHRGGGTGSQSPTRHCDAMAKRYGLRLAPGRPAGARISTQPHQNRHYDQHPSIDRREALMHYDEKFVPCTKLSVLGTAPTNVNASCSYLTDWV